jgi:predicted CXXCH cytochrome family protein
MRKKLLVAPLASVAVIGLLALPMTSTAEITGSAHDFSGNAWSGGEICIVCHTPHNASTTTLAPLWNHDITTATYTPYDSWSFRTAFHTPYDCTGTITECETEIPADYVTAGPASRLCLSCHDGTVAVDSFGGAPSGGGTISIPSEDNLGTDLSDDHPIGIDWMHQTSPSKCNAIDGGCHDLHPLASDGVTALENPRPARLDAQFVSWWYGTPDGHKNSPGPGLKVECPSCHEVHNTAGNDHLLRMNNFGSALCQRCHQK